MRKLPFSVVFMLFLFSCHNNGNKVKYSFYTTYHEIQFSVANPISSSYKFYNSDHNSDIEGEQQLQFKYSDSDTGIISVHQIFNNQLNCDKADSLVFSKQKLLILEADINSSGFSQFVDTIYDIRFFITRYNRGCNVTFCLGNDSYAGITLTNVKNTQIIDDFLLSFSVK